MRHCVLVSGCGNGNSPKEPALKASSTRSVIIAMYAAIICASAFIVIPLGPVPIVIQNMLAIMSGALFGLPQGAAAVGLFMIAGALGLPVFSGGKGGMAVLSGPTGGFITGYFIGAIICGYISKKPEPDEPIFEKKKLAKIFLAGLAGFASTYFPGVIQFMRTTDLSFSAAMATCVVPFLPADLVKLVLMVPLAAKLRPVAARYMYQELAQR